ncbi:hypothetical protein C9374_013328 [Naegleria lovaniensis]|uniref:non-specific serine/threonine protein kinase n=1 Tax=Naegleria lovaniensis TaxID=51637 RepID=A0AA88GZ43_NAELO|nr:uncharacterized protein C9374_013328 [Naegleria lovaniensis]KAG2391843.1 hypothetical protein C9374_013328 [Naegleria lovaniensis]
MKPIPITKPLSIRQQPINFSSQSYQECNANDIDDNTSFMLDHCINGSVPASSNFSTKKSISSSLTKDANDFMAKKTLSRPPPITTSSSSTAPNFVRPNVLSPTLQSKRKSANLTSPTLSPNFIPSNSLQTLNSNPDNEKIMLDFFQVFQKQQAKSNDGSGASSTDEDEVYMNILSSSLSAHQDWSRIINKVDNALVKSPSEALDDNDRQCQSFHSITELDKKKVKRNWFRFMKIESDSSFEDEENSDSEEESANHSLDKKEILLLFLLQHVAKELNPDMSFFLNLCKHLGKLGYFSDKMTDENFIKTLCKDFMQDIADIFPSIVEHETSKGKIVRSESHASYLSEISHSPSSLRDNFGSLDDIPVLDSMFYNTKRLEADYCHFQKLGKSKPYSSIIKATHRIDGRTYAIKKVHFHFKNTLELEHVYSYVVNEITALAKLDHENVIRFYAAWFEPSREHECSQQKENEFTTSDLSHEDASPLVWNDTHIHNMDLLEHDFLKKSPQTLSSRLTNSIQFESPKARPIDIHCKNNTSSPPPNMSYLEFALERKKTPNTTKKTYIDTETQNITSSVKSILHEMFNVNNHFEMVLYIVMQLCEGTTLEDWLSEKKKNKKLHHLQEALRLFKQILKGVCHIHAHGLVHKNLKPNNIFVLSNGVIKIADFGLAKYLQECLLSHCKDGSNRKKSSQHSAEQSSLYSSPEQIFNSKFDQKGDIFSLGVILFELIAPSFITTTERVHVLTQLRKKEFPEEMIKNFPREIEIVKQCLEKPNNRPTAQELLHKISRLIKAYKIEGKFSNSSKTASNLHMLSTPSFPSYDTIKEKNRIIEEQQKQIEMLLEQLKNVNSK